MIWVGGVVLGMSGAAVWAQTPSEQKPEQKMCDYTVTSGDGQTVTGKKPCEGTAVPTDTPLAKRLPYPGDPAPSEPAAANPVVPAEPGVPATPSQGNAGGMKDAGSSGESSSSSSSSNAASVPAEGPPPDPDDVNSDTPVAPKRNLHKKPVYSMETQPVAVQVANDLQVAGFYMKDGNWRGAYGRASDAMKLDDSNPDTHLAVANAARKLGKLDEAVKEYKRTLALDPVPKARKEAEKALKEMVGDQ
jgi:hypothetical protein